MIRFIIGHEYGHVIKGHLNERMKRTIKIKDENLDVITLNWEQEYEADEFGMFLNIACTKEGENLIIPIISAQLFFSVIDIIEKSISILQTGTIINRKSESHPPPGLRVKKIEGRISEKFL